MVGLPSVDNREKILRTLLAKEKVEGEVDFKGLATMTEGYTGSDLKVITNSVTNFVTSACYIFTSDAYPTCPLSQTVNAELVHNCCLSAC